MRFKSIGCLCSVNRWVKYYFSLSNLGLLLNDKEQNKRRVKEIDRYSHVSTLFEQLVRENVSVSADCGGAGSFKLEMGALVVLYCDNTRFIYLLYGHYLFDNRIRL